MVPYGTVRRISEYHSYADNLESPSSNNQKPNIFSRFSTRRIRSRLVEKDGEYNISLANVEKQKIKYFTDIFTTLIELKWRWVLTVFVFSFLLSWLFFAIVYYVIMYLHGDFDFSTGEDEDGANYKSSSSACLTNTKSFLAVFMFSMETQHTIGYGSRYPSEQCPEIVAALCLQSIFGLMIQTLLAGVVFAKLSRPHKRAATLIFSRNACICMRDGKLCFLFRVGDMRKTHLAEAHVRVQLISKRVTNEGELLPFQQFDMDVGFSSGLDRIFVAWPITICHVIDEASPLYEYSGLDLARARFEITVILEGVVQNGATMQATSSYLPSEIIWGSRFEKLVTYKRDNGKYEIDFSKFHNTYDVDTPMLSAKEIDILKMAGLNFQTLYRCENLDKVINSDDTPYDSIQKQENMHRKSIVHHLASNNEYKLLLPFVTGAKIDDGETCGSPFLVVEDRSSIPPHGESDYSFLIDSMKAGPKGIENTRKDDMKRNLSIDWSIQVRRTC
uniref:G protein-activated inward rectifier potassium channel 3 n=1 Tax=Romanomermis culicivorax TaxID=13658 RepID=A0A915J9F7_ROMCU